ncbi:MAG: hypothetical protein M3478_14505, partial [Planctomycetota bacterium]|nr:hypothetical protein [Planctomycetota bacterium]
GSLVAIMVMTLLWWGRYAGTAEMEPVLSQAFSAEDIGRAQMHLKSNGIPAKIEGDRILVSAGQREEAVAALAFAGLMPLDSASAVDEMTKKLNSFMPQTMTEAMFKEAKQQTMQNVIRRWPGVKQADVWIEPAGPRKLGVRNEATASISITMKDNGPGTRKLAESAAAFVAGAQQQLPVQNIAVVIGERRYRMSDSGGVAGSDELGEIVAGHEHRIEEKVHGLFPYIDGLFVKVAVDVNLTSLQAQNKTYDTIQQKEKRTNTRTETEPAGTGRVTEPGAMPNTGATIDPQPLPQAAGERSVEENESEYENFAGTKTTMENTPAGKFSVVSAAVRVPRSYFLKMFQNSSGSTAEPTAVTLQPIVEAEIAKMRDDVVAAASIEDGKLVSVSMYDDSPGPLRVAATVTPGGTIATSIGTYSKEIAIGALAVISLFMVSMMVRKGTPAPVMAMPALPRETPHLDGSPEVAGIVGDTNQLLDGMELDEDAVRTQQMLDQVSTLVGENPDAAANLVKRWLNRT